MPTVSTGNYTIGMVDLYFEATVAHASLLATDSTVETGKGGAFRTDARSLGNIVGLELNPDITYVDHFVADRGTRKKDKTTTSMVSLTIPFTFDEMNYNNLQRYFVGSSLSNTTIAPFEKALFTGCAQMVFRTDVGKKILLTLNWVKCWNLLKSFYHSIIGNDKCDGLKSERIGQSAAKSLKGFKSMGKVQRLENEANQPICFPRTPNTLLGVMI